APAFGETPTAIAAAHAASAPAQTQASGWNPPCVRPSAGTSTSGIAATTLRLVRAPRLSTRALSSFGSVRTYGSRREGARPDDVLSAYCRRSVGPFRRRRRRARAQARGARRRRLARDVPAFRACVRARHRRQPPGAAVARAAAAALPV